MHQINGTNILLTRGDTGKVIFESKRSLAAVQQSL